MSLSINTNIASMNAQRNLALTSGQLGKSLQRLSSGLRINGASDDAAGLAISENMKAGINGMNQAVRNANDGVSLLQTAEGALNETSNILTRMRELAVQSANGTLSSTQRTSVQAEVSQLTSEIDRIANSTAFNGINLLDGTTTTVSFQVGANNTANDKISVTLSKADAATISVSSTTVSVDTQASAQTALTAIDNAIQSISTMRGTLGAMQNRLSSTINNLRVAIENTSAAQSRIADVDVASETAALTRAQILTQAGTAILAQANQTPQSALSLLR